MTVWWMVGGRGAKIRSRVPIMSDGARVAGGFTGGACEPRGMTKSAEATADGTPPCHGGVEAEVSLLWGSGPFGCRVA